MFCSWLRKNRRALGLTQAALGEAIGVGGGAVSAWEKGRRVPGPRAAARLGAFFAGLGISMPPPPRQPRQPERERFGAEVRRALAAQQNKGPKP